MTKMLGSTFWIFMIAFGAALVAVSNIQYNRTRESENKLAKAAQVWALLEPEIRRNRQTVEQITAAITSRTIVTDTIDTTAWQTVSNSDLLLGLPNEELATLLHTYRLINQANSIHAKILDAVVGITSALHDSQNHRDVFLSELSAILNQLSPLLKALDEKLAYQAAMKKNIP
jgi:hypothetical protein